MSIRFTVALALVAASAAHAQEPTLTSIFPAGGQRGTTVEVAVEGKNLAEVRGLFFSKPGLTAKVVKGNRVAIEIAKDAPERDCDVWAVTAKGLSHPRRFTVGGLPEFSEKEDPKQSNDDPKFAHAISIPVVINGTIAPGTDRDFYRFDAKAGQKLTFAFRSETLDGTARPALTVFNSTGNEIFHNDGRSSEPVIEFGILKNGAYLLQVEERSFQLGENNVYRLAIFEGPCLMGAFPSVIGFGKAPDVTLLGDGFANGEKKASIPAPVISERDGGGWMHSSAANLQGFRFWQPGWFGSARIGLTDDPVAVEADAEHATKEKAQVVPFPSAIAGRFLKPREVDWYRFSLKNGQYLWAESVGERTIPTMDLEVTFYDPQGKPVLTLAPPGLAKGETPPPVQNKTSDGWGLLKAEVDGEHYLSVRDHFGSTRWGPTRTYQVNIGPRREEVTVMTVPGPSGLSVAPGGSVKLGLFVIRRGGHEAPIRIRATDLPGDVAGKEVVIPAKENAGTFVLEAAKGAKEWVGKLNLVAETEIGGKKDLVRVVAITSVRVGAQAFMRRCDGIVAAILNGQ